MYTAGITQGLMWRAFDETGRLAYPDFIETVVKLVPMYWVRMIGGSLYLSGVLLAAVNLVMTWKIRGADLSDTLAEAPPLAPIYTDPPKPPSPRRPAQTRPAPRNGQDSNPPPESATPAAATGAPGSATRTAHHLETASVPAAVTTLLDRPATNDRALRMSTRAHRVKY
jgi:hypothetical protein